MLVFFFFFSSRRRHTRFDCDWSSDVCSSDLGAIVVVRGDRIASVGTAAAPAGARVIDLGDATLLRSEEHTSELQSQSNLVCRLLLEKKKIEKQTSKRSTTKTIKTHINKRHSWQRITKS